MTQPPFGPQSGDEDGSYKQGPGGYGNPGFGAPNYGPQGYGMPGYGGAYSPPPDNYLVWAILVTVFCCLPLGIVSIVKSSKVTTLWAQGQQAEAYAASQEAKKFAVWGAIAGVVLSVLIVVGYIVVFASLFAASSSSTY
jgi:hypothetical protein